MANEVMLPSVALKIQSGGNGANSFASAIQGFQVNRELPFANDKRRFNNMGKVYSIVDTIDKYDEQIRKMQRDALVKEQVNNAHEYLANRLNDYQTLQNEDAVKGFEEYQNDVQSFVKQNKNLFKGDAELQNAYDNAVSGIASRASIEAKNWNNKQTQSYHNAQLDATIATKAQDFFTHIDSPLFNQYLNEYDQALRESIEFNGIHDPNSDIFKIKTQQGYSKLADTAVDSFINEKRYGNGLNFIAKLGDRLDSFSAKILTQKLLKAQETEAQRQSVLANLSPKTSTDVYNSIDNWVTTEEGQLAWEQSKAEAIAKVDKIFLDQIDAQLNAEGVISLAERAKRKQEYFDKLHDPNTDIGRIYNENVGVNRELAMNHKFSEARHSYNVRHDARKGMIETALKSLRLQQHMNGGHIDLSNGLNGLLDETTKRDLLNELGVNWEQELRDIFENENNYSKSFDDRIKSVLKSGNPSEILKISNDLFDLGNDYKGKPKDSTLKELQNTVDRINNNDPEILNKINQDKALQALSMIIYDDNGLDTKKLSSDSLYRAQNAQQKLQIDKAVLLAVDDFNNDRKQKGQAPRGITNYTDTDYNYIKVRANLYLQQSKDQIATEDGYIKQILEYLQDDNYYKDNLTETQLQNIAINVKDNLLDQSVFSLGIGQNTLSEQTIEQTFKRMYPILNAKRKAYFVAEENRIKENKKQAIKNTSNANSNMINLLNGR